MLPYPAKNIKDIVSVQPMKAPVGHVFYYDCTYGQQQLNLNNDIFTLKPMLATTTLDQIKSIKVQNCDSVQELLENLSKLHELITQKYQSGTWFTDEESECVGSKLVLAANFGTKKVVSSAEDQEKISDKLLEIENFFYSLPYSFFYDHSGTEEAGKRNDKFEKVAIEVTNRSIVRPNNATIESKILSDFTGIQYKFLRYHSLNQEVGLAYFQVQNFLKNHGVFCSSLMLFELARDFTTRYENQLKIQAYKDEAVSKNKKQYPIRVAALTEPIKVVKESNTIALITHVIYHYESMLHSPDPYTLSVHHKALREYLEQVNLTNFKPCVSIDYYIAQTYILVQLMNEDLKTKKFDKRKELGDCVAKFLKTVPSASNNDEFVTRDTSEIEMAVELLKQNWTNYELVYKEHEFNQIQEELTRKMNDPKTNFDELRKQQKELLDKHFSKEEQKELMAEVFANRQAEKDAKELFENIKKVNEQILKTTVKPTKLTDQQAKYPNHMDSQFVQELARELTKTLGNIPVEITVETLDENKKVIDSKTVKKVPNDNKPIQLTFDFAEPIKLESVPIVATKKKLDTQWKITNVLSFSDLKKQINSLELTRDVIKSKHEDKIKLPYLKPTSKSVQQILPLLESIKYHKELFVTEVMDKEKGSVAIQQLYSFLVFCVWDDYSKAEQDQVKECLSELDTVIFERACEDAKKKGLFEEDVNKQTINLIKSFKDLKESLWYERKLNEGKPDTVIPQCSPKILVPLLKDLKQLPDNDSIVENNKIFKEVARYIVDGKLSCIFYGDKETEEVYNWYLDTFFPKQFDHFFDRKIKSLTERKTSSTTDDDIAYRIAVKQLLSLTQDWLVNEQFKKNKESALAFFKTDLGLAVVASTVLTLAASRFPKKHLERLSRELRVSTLALAGNETVQMLQDFFKKAESTFAIESTIPLLEQKQESSRALGVNVMTITTATNNVTIS